MVFVIDCTATWAPPPMGTSPTFICRLVMGRSRSAASVILLPYVLYTPILIRDERLSSEDLTQVSVGGEEEKGQDEDEPESGDLAHRLFADRPTQHLLRRYKEQVPAVERQYREQIEQGQVEADQSQKRQEEPLVHSGATDRRDADGTGHVLVKILLAGYELPDEDPELDRYLAAALHRQADGLHGPLLGRLHFGTHANERPVFVFGIGPQLPIEGLLRTVAHDGHAHLLARLPARHLAFESVPTLYPLAIEADDPVAGPDPDLLGHRSRLDSTYYGLHVRNNSLEHVDASEYDHGREDVGHRTGEYDQGPPPQGFGVIGVRALRTVSHPRHLGKPAQEYYAERVDGLADLLLDERWPETYRELGDPYAEGLGREHMPEFVDDYEEDQAQQGHDDGHGVAPSMRRCAASRAHPSTARMVSMLCIFPKSGTVSRTSSIASAIRRNLILPSRKASTATSLAALSATG